MKSLEPEQREIARAVIAVVFALGKLIARPMVRTTDLIDESVESADAMIEALLK